MPSSLNTLDSNLVDDQLNTVKLFFSNDIEFQLMRKTGIFPYENLDSASRLEETSLPPREAFYSNLTERECSQDDYDHALKVWKHFSCSTLKDYLELYLKADAFPLTDIFENFRKICMQIYSLDPAQYFTKPERSWEAMLKTTNIKLDLLTDIDMYRFIQSSIRGGFVQCCHIYTKANNKYLSDYDSSKESSILMYVDANNLYGWAMSQPLPYKDFKWMLTTDIDNFGIHNIPFDSKYGYFLEVDLIYPYRLHDLHNDLPFCPSNCLSSKEDMLKKLIADLGNKKNYVIHYRNLQQCIQNGLKLKKIQTGVHFL